MEENSKQQILNAAIEVFVQKGFAGARMQEIADKAKINKAMLHYYFKSKKELFRVIIRQTMGEVIPKFAKAIENEGTVLEKFEYLIQTYIGAIKASPHVPIFILHELSQNREEFVEEIKNKLPQFPNFQAFFMQIMQEMEKGTLRKYAPMHLIMNTMSLCVFPFVAQPIFTNILDIPDEVFNQVMENREKEVIAFVKNALLP